MEAVQAVARRLPLLVCGIQHPNVEFCIERRHRAD
jgi:hypothetical protein